MASGLPVLASDLPYAREACSQAAVYFDPYKPQEMANTIRKTLGDNELLEYLSNKSLDRAKYFSWKVNAEETMGLFNGL